MLNLKKWHNRVLVTSGTVLICLFYATLGLFTGECILTFRKTWSLLQHIWRRGEIDIDEHLKADPT